MTDLLDRLCYTDGGGKNLHSSFASTMLAPITRLLSSLFLGAFSLFRAMAKSLSYWRAGENADGAAKKRKSSLLIHPEQGKAAAVHQVFETPTGEAVRREALRQVGTQAAAALKSAMGQGRP